MANRQRHTMKKFLSELNNSSSKGMSLIEILIVLTLIGLIATFITGKIFQQLEEGRRDATRIQLSNLATRLKEYRRYCNRYPDTEQGLEALISKPTSGPECKRYPSGGLIDGDRVPLDPWDNEYEYESDGHKFKVYSYGPKGPEAEESEWIIHGKE